MDWHQLWTIISLPDNIPIVGMIFIIPFFTWYGLRQAFANDRLAERLEKDKDMAKTHHRKVHPFQKGWQREVAVWPYLLRMEFLAAIIVTFILMVWSITLDAPLEEPANPSLTMNPSKAPWYFLGLQEMLVYFDPWIAGVVMPTLIIIGLIVIPYIDENPLGNGYYTYKQRRFAIWTFIFGFIILWTSMIVIGTLIRGPGWMWFWPGMTWDHNRLIFEINRDLHEIVGITSPAMDRDLRLPGRGRLRDGCGVSLPPHHHGDRVLAQDTRPHVASSVRDPAGSADHHARAAGEDCRAAPVPHQVRLGHALVQRVDAAPATGF